jgi:hypothetical protein
MATLAETNDVGALIAGYLRDAETGRTRDPAGGIYSPASLRSLRRSFDHIEAVAGHTDAAVLRVMDDAALERLGRQVVDQDGLPPGQLGPIVHALRCLSEYAAGRSPAEPLTWVDPPASPDPPRWADRLPRATAAYRPPPAETQHASEPDPAAAPEAPTPTFTMLALGAHVSAWIERIVVIAFVLTAIGLALELL